MDTTLERIKVVYENKDGGFIEGPGTMLFTYRGKVKNSGAPGNVTVKAEVFDKGGNLLGSETKTIHLGPSEEKEFIIEITAHVEADEGEHWSTVLGEDYYKVMITKQQPD